MSKKILALDFGGTYLKYAIVDENRKLSCRGERKAPKSSKEEFLNLMQSIYGEIKDQVDGIAVSFGGTLKPNTGIVISSYQFPFFQGCDLVEMLSEYFPVPISVSNDANCAAYAEMKYGCMQGIKNGLLLVLGTGIGGSLILDGHIYNGTAGRAAEFSVIRPTLNTDFGMVWAEYGGGANGLIRLVKEKKHTTETLTGRQIFEQIEQGDQDALNGLKEYCHITAVQLYNIQAMLDLERIGIGGGISAQPMLIQMINEYLQDIYKKEEHLKLVPVKPEIAVCQFKNDANLIGARCIWDEMEK